MSIDLRPLHGQRVLVTGATGFIGSHLCRKLRAAGADLTTVSRSAKPRDEGCHWWQLDLCDSKLVNDVVANARPQVIIHLASHVTGSRSLRTVNTALQNNLVSTVNLLTAATEHGCHRIILAGSLEEPGSAIAIPASPYAASKWAASGYARMFWELYRVQTIHLRIAMVYGPGQQDSSKLVPYVIRSVVSGRSPEIFSGCREVDWVYVDDVVDALVASVITAVEGFLSLDIGTGRAVSIREVVERLSRLVDPRVQPRFRSNELRPLEANWAARTQAAAEAIHWRAHTTLDDGLRQTVDWYCHTCGVDRS